MDSSLFPPPPHDFPCDTQSLTGEAASITDAASDPPDTRGLNGSGVVDWAWLRSVVATPMRRSESTALGLGALFFAVCHVDNNDAGFTSFNWPYGILALIAGWLYGYTWHKTGLITVAALVHATTDYLWWQCFTVNM